MMILVIDKMIKVMMNDENDNCIITITVRLILKVITMILDFHFNHDHDYFITVKVAMISNDDSDDVGD